MNKPTNTQQPAQNKVNPRRFKPATAGTTVATAQAEKAEKGSGLNQVVVRNEFYRDGYRNLLRIAVIEAFAIILLILTVVWVVNTNRPENF